MKVIELLEKLRSGVLDKKEAQNLLEVIENDNNFPNREKHINRLKKILDRIERAEIRRAEREREWKRQAEEYKAITDNWLRLGATYKSNNVFTRWFYNDDEFFK